MHEHYVNPLHDRTMVSYVQDDDRTTTASMYLSLNAFSSRIQWKLFLGLLSAGITKLIGTLRPKKKGFLKANCYEPTKPQTALFCSINNHFTYTIISHVPQTVTPYEMDKIKNLTWPPKSAGLSNIYQLNREKVQYTPNYLCTDKPISAISIHLF